MNTEEQKIHHALREFLWMAVVWNDHNFDELTVPTKCRIICEELGIKSADDANNLLQRVEVTVARLLKEPK